MINRNGDFRDCNLTATIRKYGHEMKKLHEKKILAVGSIIVFFVMLWSWIVPVECELTIRATIGDCNPKTISAEDLSPVAFLVKGAAELLRSQCFIDELARKYIQLQPNCPMDRAKKMLRNVRVEQNKSDAMLWNVKTVAQSVKEARTIVDFYSERIIEHFTEDRMRLERKITAWFDQQKYHKARRNENVAELENAKRNALMQEQSRSVRVIKTDIVKVRRKWLWFLR